eukprot:COSAG03_NODE_18035_length_363_cov_0.852273_1_plen_75_part_01
MCLCVCLAHLQALGQRVKLAPASVVQRAVFVFRDGRRPIVQPPVQREVSERERERERERKRERERERRTDRQTGR